METPSILDMERAEIEASHAIFEAAPADMRAEIGLRSELWDDAHFSLTRGYHSAVFNRLHLPNGAAPDDERIARAIAQFREAGVGCYLIQAPPCPGFDETERQVLAAGLKPYRRDWIQFWRDGQPLDAPTSGLDLVEVDETNADLWAQVTVRNFNMPDVMTPWLASMAQAPRWHAYLSLDNGAAVGGGLFYLNSNATAWFGMGSTSRTARGRGGQTAMLARRINDAATLGARWMVVETGAAIPGEPQTSYRNIERAGFRAIYARHNWGET